MQFKICAINLANPNFALNIISIIIISTRRIYDNSNISGEKLLLIEGKLIPLQDYFNVS